MEGELYLAPGFPIPPNTDYKGYHNYIDECLPPETPYLYGLHPNAEIEFLTNTSENLFRIVFEMQPRDTGAGAGGGVSREEKVGLFLLIFMPPPPFEEVGFYCFAHVCRSVGRLVGRSVDKLCPINY